MEDNMCEKELMQLLDIFMGHIAPYGIGQNVTIGFLDGFQSSVNWQAKYGKYPTQRINAVDLLETKLLDIQRTGKCRAQHDFTEHVFVDPTNGGVLQR